MGYAHSLVITVPPLAGIILSFGRMKINVVLRGSEIMSTLTRSPAWQALKAAPEEHWPQHHLRELFAARPASASTDSPSKQADILLDYSKNLHRLRKP